MQSFPEGFWIRFCQPWLLGDRYVRQRMLYELISIVTNLWWPQVEVSYSSLGVGRSLDCLLTEERECGKLAGVIVTP